MKKFLLTVLGIAAFGAAHAQLIFNGTTHGATFEDKCNITYATQSTSVGQTDPVGGTLNVRLSGHTNVLLQRLSSTSWSAITTTYFNFEIGNTPVLMNTVHGADSGKFNGKQVLAGGSILPTSTSLNTTCRTTWFEYLDVDHDGQYDEGVEDLMSITGTGVLMENTPLTGNTYQVYDINNLTWGGGPVPYIFGAQRNYLLQIKQEMRGVLDEGSTNPFRVATHEYSAPFTGWDLQYTYQTVPEPATFASLGLAAMALVSRRRKSKN